MASYDLYKQLQRYFTIFYLNLIGILLNYVFSQLIPVANIHIDISKGTVNKLLTVPNFYIYKYSLDLHQSFQ